MMIADKDLLSIQQARILAENAFEAQKQLALFPQEKLDEIVEGVADALEPHLQALAVLSQEETDYGCWQDKLTKNRFACRTVRDALRGMRCVGVLQEDAAGHPLEIGVPKGVIAALCPATNPVSTAIYTTLLALKSGNALLFSLHPRALKTMRQLMELMIKAAHAHGLPEGCLAYLDTVTRSGTLELMRHPAVAQILLTGVSGLMQEARDLGKPLICGGMGNGPAFIERTANIEQAVQDIIASKSFDYGLAPSAEQSVVLDAAIAKEAKTFFQQYGAYFMSDALSLQLLPVLFRADGRRNRETLGLSAVTLARKAGFSVPETTKLLIAERRYVRDSDPYGRELLAPVLACYVEDDWQHACEKCIELLLHEREAHTLVIHSSDEEVIRLFALKKPVARLLVNTPSAFGGMGMTTDLFPAMTLGCGIAGYGSTSDNVSPLHLIYRRKVGYGVKRAGTTGVNAVYTQQNPEESEPMQLLRQIVRTGLQGLKTSETR